MADTPSGMRPGSRVADQVPGSLGWRLIVAGSAHKFFNPVHPERAAMAAAIGRPFTDNAFEAWTASDFANYVLTTDLKPGDASAITRILASMERAGLLMSAGWDSRLPLLGQQYISQGSLSAQMSGYLWLSEVVGPDLIIQAYKSVTVQISAVDSPHWGSGLVLDEGHILTNKHVVRKLEGQRLEIVCPGWPESSTPHNFRCLDDHPDIDVAVIQVDPPSLKPTPGMVFRDPAWADEVFVLGYPRVAWMVDTGLILQRGEVVKPIAEVPAVVQDDAEPWDRPERTKMFLYSAIARPGNSGGPIVAHDGRVIGIVHESAQLTDSFGVGPVEQASMSHATSQFPTLNAAWAEILKLTTCSSGHEEARPSQKDEPQPDATEQAEPFYRGIPASEIRRALKHYRLEHLMTFEDPLNL